jgi:hypothetical protein
LCFLIHPAKPASPKLTSRRELWRNEHAYWTPLYLNNKYFLDGRDPNSFANVFRVFGQHDRGWTERGV